MTDDQVNEGAPRGDLLSDSEINEAVARKLGWTGIYETAFEFEQMGTVDPIKKVTKLGEFRRKVKPIPAYSTDIAAAWEIVEKNTEIQFNGTKHFFLTKNGFGQWLSGWVKREAWGDFDSVFDTVADTAPRAIALAFLKLR